MKTEVKESAARRKILDVASDLFYRNGIRATGIDAVIEAAEVARMTLYNHFPTKDALIAEVLRERGERVEAAWSAITTDPALTPQQRLLALFDWLGEAIALEGFRGCPLANAAIENPDKASAAFCAATSCADRIEDVVARCVGELGASDPAGLTQQLMLLINGAQVRAQLGHGGAAAQAARQSAAQAIDGAMAE